MNSVRDVAGDGLVAATTVATETNASAAGVDVAGARRLVSIAYGPDGYVDMFLDGEGARKTVTPISISPGQGMDVAFQMWRRWLAFHPRTGGWPTLGTAGKGWTIPAVVKQGDPVCPLLVAIATERYDVARWIIQTLDLGNAPQSWRQHAGELAVRLMRSAVRLNGLPNEMLSAAAALVMCGAELDDLRCLQPGVTQDQALHVVGAPDHMESAALTCMLFAPDFQPVGAELFVQILRRHPERAAEWSDAAYEGAGPAHLCVMACNEQALAGILEIPGLIDQEDDNCRTPLMLAEELRHVDCANVLKACAARQAARAALNEITQDRAGQPWVSMKT